MKPRPITEDDLHAFVDDVLDSARRTDVAAWLAAHPDMAERIAGWRRQRQSLRETLAPIADEPLPPELNLRRMLAARTPASGWRGWRLPYWAMSAAAAVLLCVGGISGWMLRGMEQAQGLMALGQEAVVNYRVYAPDRFRPVELRAEEQNLLAAWALECTGRPIAIPELAAVGYRFMGGRMVAGAQGAAILLMYDDDQGTRLGLLARPMTDARTSTMAPVTIGEVHGFVWSDEGFGYSLVGAATAETLHPLANEIRQQIRGSA